MSLIGKYTGLFAVGVLFVGCFSSGVFAAEQGIRLNVPLVGQMAFGNRLGPNQPGSMACWYAAACMVSYYFEVGPRLGLPSVWESNSGLTASDVDRLAKIEGLIVPPHVPGPLDGPMILEILKAFGPIWVAGHYLEGDPYATHAIVITGVDSSFVFFNDPWEPKAKRRPCGWIAEHILELPNAILVKRR